MPNKLTPDEEKEAQTAKLRKETAARLFQEPRESDAAFSYRVEKELAEEIRWRADVERRQRVASAQNVLNSNGGAPAIGALAKNDLLAEVFGGKP